MGVPMGEFFADVLFGERLGDIEPLLGIFAARLDLGLDWRLGDDIDEPSTSELPSRASTESSTERGL